MFLILNFYASREQFTTSSVENCGFPVYTRIFHVEKRKLVNTTKAQNYISTADTKKRIDERSCYHLVRFTHASEKIPN